MSKLPRSFWAAEPMPAIRLLDDLRTMVLARSHTRLPKWKFRLADTLVVQIQPRPAERRDHFRLFEGVAIEGANIAATDFTSASDRRSKHQWRLIFGVCADGESWAAKPRQVSWPTPDNLQADQFRARVITALRSNCFDTLDASMMLKPACLCCGKGLTDPASMARWIGPECSESSSVVVPFAVKLGDAA